MLHELEAQAAYKLGLCSRAARKAFSYNMIDKQCLRLERALIEGWVDDDGTNCDRDWFVHRMLGANITEELLDDEDDDEIETASESGPVSGRRDGQPVDRSRDDPRKPNNRAAPTQANRHHLKAVGSTAPPNGCLAAPTSVEPAQSVRYSHESP